jgi:DNA-binding transcriptional LysR family regulator
VRYDLVDLRLFVAVVAAGSITGGARRVHLSLPSASARVRALEDSAGVPLLERVRRGVRPTPAGTALARHAREVLGETARLDGALASYARGAAAPLRLVAGTSPMYDLVPRALVAFLRARPTADVDVADLPSTESVARLAAGEADLGVVLADVARAAGMDIEPLAPDPLVVIGAAGGVLAGRGPLSWPEVAEHPMVGLRADAPLQEMITGRIGPHAPVPRYRTRADGLGTVVALAAAGVGVAVVPRRALPAGVAVEVRELTEPWAARELALCRGAGTVPAEAEHLAAHLRDVSVPAEG